MKVTWLVCVSPFCPVVVEVEPRGGKVCWIVVSSTSPVNAKPVASAISAAFDEIRTRNPS